MRRQTKSLLIHNDTTTSQVTAVVVDERNLLKKTQEFFKKISENNSCQGVVLKLEGNETNYAIAHERENFIIVSKKGSTKSARLYGNWDEALNFARKIIAGEQNFEKNFKFIVTEYKPKPN